MDLNQTIQKYSSHPLTHQLLMSFLKDYKRPNDKLKALKAEGVIESIKKGLYIAGPKISSLKPEKRFTGKSNIWPKLCVTGNCFILPWSYF